MVNYFNEKYSDYLEVANSNTDVYQSSEPFPSIYFLDFFNPEALDDVIKEFPDLSKSDAIHYNDKNQKKFAGKGEVSFGPATTKFMHFLNSEPFLKFLQKLTGIEETLFGDPYFGGGGLHEIKRGGLLKVHADFNKHPKAPKFDRRLNLLIYLNKDWKEEYGGHLELWDRDMSKPITKILPVFNTAALFSTESTTYHGHPDPLNCPEDRSRKSLALYYFTIGRPDNEYTQSTKHTTLFKARPEFEDELEAKSSSIPKMILKNITPPIIWKAIKNISK